MSCRAFNRMYPRVTPEFIAALLEQPEPDVDFGEEQPPPGVPHDVWRGLKRYVEDHVSTGGFLRAVLENDLSSAIFKADADNLVAIEPIVRFVYNFAPNNSWGTPEKVQAWLALR